MKIRRLQQKSPEVEEREIRETTIGTERLSLSQDVC